MRTPRQARDVETGLVLATLVAFLTVTGILLSPTISQPWILTRVLQSEWSLGLYVSHLAAAALLVAFTLWHLVPWTRSLWRKRDLAWGMQLASWSLLALVAVETVTGVMLYAHLYALLPKAIAVAVHLGATFVVLVPFVVHLRRGLRVRRERAEATAAALAAADEAGRADEARAAQARRSRRAFLRMGAYAAAGAALAVAIGQAASRQVRGWRLNSVGKTPELTKESYRLRVTGLVERPLELTYDDLLAMPVESVRFTHRCVEGWTYTDTFTGTRLAHVLERAGGAKRGAKQLVFRSPEVSLQRFGHGQLYTTNFPVEDTEDVFLVWKVGGQDLPPEHGFPVRLMSPRKWGYKACKWLTEIEVVDDAAYRGYWERLGYHNDGDYPGPIFA